MAVSRKLRSKVLIQLIRGIKYKHNELKFGNDIRLSILDGFNVLNQVIASTLGSQGRNVLLSQKYNKPKITKDPLLISKEMHIKDNFKNMGLDLIKDITLQTNFQSGDTSISAVLAFSILNEATKNIHAGYDILEIKRGIKMATNFAINYLESIKKDIVNDEELKQIAKYSCNGDDHLGALVSEAVTSAGKNGIVTIENGSMDKISIKKGLRFQEGFINSQFGNLKNMKGEVELNNPLILLHKDTMRHSQSILPALSYSRRNNRPLLIITDGLEGDALEIALLNKRNKQVNVVAVRSPGIDEIKMEYFLNIEAYTGAKLVDPKIVGIHIASSANKEVFGTASRVIVSANETIVIGRRGSAKAIEDRIENLKTKLRTKSFSTVDKEIIKDCLARLTDGIVVIQFCANSYLELEEKKSKLNQGLSVTYSALKNGCLPGNGVALLQASNILKKMNTNGLSIDAKIGVDIVNKALSTPFNKIFSNAGHNANILKTKVNNDVNSCLNIHGEVVDMYKSGIIDPFNFIKSALLNALNITTLIATTEVGIVRGKDIRRRRSE